MSNLTLQSVVISNDGGSIDVPPGGAIIRSPRRLIIQRNGAQIGIVEANVESKITGPGRIDLLVIDVGEVAIEWLPLPAAADSPAETAEK